MVGNNTYQSRVKDLFEQKVIKICSTCEKPMAEEGEDQVAWICKTCGQMWC